jgi:hypothetical protein
LRRDLGEHADRAVRLHQQQVIAFDPRSAGIGDDGAVAAGDEAVRIGLRVVGVELILERDDVGRRGHDTLAHGRGVAHERCPGAERITVGLVAQQPERRGQAPAVEAEVVQADHRVLAGQVERG